MVFLVKEQQYQSKLWYNSSEQKITFAQTPPHNHRKLLTYQGLLLVTWICYMERGGWGWRGVYEIINGRESHFSVINRWISCKDINKNINLSVIKRWYISNRFFFLLSVCLDGCMFAILLTVYGLITFESPWYDLRSWLSFKNQLSVLSIAALHRSIWNSTCSLTTTPPRWPCG